MIHFKLITTLLSLTWVTLGDVIDPGNPSEPISGPQESSPNRGGVTDGYHGLIGGYFQQLPLSTYLDPKVRRPLLTYLSLAKLHFPTKQAGKGPHPREDPEDPGGGQAPQPLDHPTFMDPDIISILLRAVPAVPQRHYDIYGPKSIFEPSGNTPNEAPLPDVVYSVEDSSSAPVGKSPIQAIRPDLIPSPSQGQTPIVNQSPVEGQLLRKAIVPHRANGSPPPPPTVHRQQPQFVSVTPKPGLVLKDGNPALHPIQKTVTTIAQNSVTPEPEASFSKEPEVYRDDPKAAVQPIYSSPYLPTTSRDSVGQQRRPLIHVIPHSEPKWEQGDYPHNPIGVPTLTGRGSQGIRSRSKAGIQPLDFPRNPPVFTFKEEVHHPWYRFLKHSPHVSPLAPPGKRQPSLIHVKPHPDPPLVLIKPEEEERSHQLQPSLADIGSNVGPAKESSILLVNPGPQDHGHSILQRVDPKGQRHPLVEGSSSILPPPPPSQPTLDTIFQPLPPHSPPNEEPNLLPIVGFTEASIQRENRGLIEQQISSTSSPPDVDISLQPGQHRLPSIHVIPHSEPIGPEVEEHVSQTILVPVRTDLSRDIKRERPSGAHAKNQNLPRPSFQSLDQEFLYGSRRDLYDGGISHISTVSPPPIVNLEEPQHPGIQLGDPFVEPPLAPRATLDARNQDGSSLAFDDIKYDLLQPEALDWGALVPDLRQPYPQKSFLSEVVSNQFHVQDIQGNVVYGYVNPVSAKEERRDSHGNVVGVYAYLDESGLPKHLSYVADEGGFRVTSTNLV